MKLCSWNVNGLRACLQKGFEEFLRREEPEILCLQEIKMNYDQLDREFEGYETVFNSAETRGYSGTAILSKRKPLTVSFDIGDLKHTGEGRSITFEFERFYLVAVYTPNAQHELTRLSYRMQWDDAFRDYVCALDRKKPVVICGDFNRRRITRTPDFRTKSAENSPSFWQPDLPTPTGIFIRRRKMLTAGGATASPRASGTSAGGSIISSFRTVCAARCRTRSSSKNSREAIIARSGFFCAKTRSARKEKAWIK